MGLTEFVLVHRRKYSEVGKLLKSWDKNPPAPWDDFVCFFSLVVFT